MLDWVAGFIELGATYLIGNKKRVGFVLHTFACILWIVVSFRTGVHGLLVLMVPSIVVNTRNWIKWWLEEKNEKLDGGPGPDPIVHTTDI